ncbi:MAG: hypothetical protein AAF734_04385, partial [Bacteroidota bacterium]
MEHTRKQNKDQPSSYQYGGGYKHGRGYQPHGFQLGYTDEDYDLEEEATDNTPIISAVPNANAMEGIFGVAYTAQEATDYPPIYIPSKGVYKYNGKVYKSFWGIWQAHFTGSYNSAEDFVAMIIKENNLKRAPQVGDVLYIARTPPQATNQKPVVKEKKPKATPKKTPPKTKKKVAKKPPEIDWIGLFEQLFSYLGFGNTELKALLEKEELTVKEIARARELIEQLQDA